MIRQFLDQRPATVQRLRAAVRGAEALELKVSGQAAPGAALNLGLAARWPRPPARCRTASHLPAHEIKGTGWNDVLFEVGAISA